MIIAQNRGAEYPWFAWIPILNLIIMWQISETETWVLVMLLIGIFCCITSIIGLVYAWMAIAEHEGRDRSLGILMIIPFVNYWAIWKIARG